MEEIKFSREMAYSINVCVSSKVMKQLVTHTERNVIYIGVEPDTKSNLLTFRRNRPEKDVKSYFHIKREYIHSVEVLEYIKVKSNI